MLPAELRERGILWKAKHDRICYAGHGYELSPCCGRAAARSFTEYLERIYQASQMESAHGEGRCKLWRLEGDGDTGCGQDSKKAWVEALREAEQINHEMDYFHDTFCTSLPEDVR